MDPYPSCLLLVNLSFHFSEVFIYLSLIIPFFVASGLISAAEMAFFALSQNDMHEIDNSENNSDKKIKKLLQNPDQLLSTILITNNIVNITIITILILCADKVLNLQTCGTTSILMQIILAALIIVLLVEILPKIYAVQNHLKVARKCADTIYVLNVILGPISMALVNTSKLFRKHIDKHRQNNMSADETSLERSEANNLPSNDNQDILNGISIFGTIAADKVMTARTDMITLNSDDEFQTVMDCILENEYSRIPVYDNSLDNIIGILYTKDLIPHIRKEASFKWQSILRKPYFVPETVKIDDLLQQFQKDKNHIAIVVDEFGGTSGLITMEDILEEIVGDISDEYDDEDLLYKKINDYTFTFEAKISLSDFAKILNIDPEFFNDISSNIDTLAGLLLELKKEIPQIGTEINYKNFFFKITDADNRRIIKVKLIIK